VAPYIAPGPRKLSSIDAIHRPIAARQPSYNVSTPLAESPLTFPPTLGQIVSPRPRSSVDSIASTEISAGSADDVLIPTGTGGVTTLSQATNKQVKIEEDREAIEEQEEMLRADEDIPEGVTRMARTPAEELSKRIVKPDDQNVFASLRQDSGASAKTLQPTPHEGKKRSPEEKEEARNRRSERLAMKLKEVFGLPEAEELLVEMPCWLLRNERESQVTCPCGRDLWC
jgi:hypothetical protein